MSEAVVVAAYGGSDQLRLQHVPDPQPAAGQVRIRTLLTSVNFADVLARRGGYEAGSAPPFIPGLDCVGTVVTVGPGVTSLQPGQRVAAFPVGGSYATDVVAPEALTYPLAPELPGESGAGLTVLVTAMNTLTLAGRLQPGETVVVHAAAGGVGSMAVQFAKALGAGRVIGTVSRAEKAPFVAGLGADAVINSSREDLRHRVLDLTNGAGADLILDSVGGETLERGLQCLAPFGRLVTFGQAGGRAASLTTPQLHRQNRAVIGYSSGHYRRARPQALRQTVEAAFGLLLSGQAALPIAARFALRDAALAHDLLERRTSTGKILLDPQA